MISAVGIFGLISISVLITINAASSQLQTMSYVTKFYQNDKNADYMLISSPVYSWIFTYVYKIDFVLSDYYNYIYQTIKPTKILLVADEHFQNDLNNKPLSELYNGTQLVEVFKSKESFNTRNYPYFSINSNNEGLHDIEVRLRSNDKHISDPR